MDNLCQRRERVCCWLLLSLSRGLLAFCSSGLSLMLRVLFCSSSFSGGTFGSGTTLSTMATVATGTTIATTAIAIASSRTLTRAFPRLLLMLLLRLLLRCCCGRS